jgi:hypothetical protein
MTRKPTRVIMQNHVGQARRDMEAALELLAGHNRICGQCAIAARDEKPLDLCDAGWAFAQAAGRATGRHCLAVQAAEAAEAAQGRLL